MPDQPPAGDRGRQQPHGKDEFVKQNESAAALGARQLADIRDRDRGGGGIRRHRHGRGVDLQPIVRRRGHWVLATRWSMAPNTGWPSNPSACIRIRSPKRMNSVFGAPNAIISMARRSAMHAEPVLRSLFDTVPEPMRVPARSRRVTAACSISWKKLKCISPPFG